MKNIILESRDGYQLVEQVYGNKKKYSLQTVIPIIISGDYKDVRDVLDTMRRDDLLPSSYIYPDKSNSDLYNDRAMKLLQILENSGQRNDHLPSHVHA